MTEATVLKKITQKLKFNKNVLFYLRVHSGGHKVSTGHFIQLAPSGTPDLLVVLKGARVLFLEVKREGVTRLRYEQRKFFESYKDVEGIYCRVINDADKLQTIIKEVLNENH